MKKYLYLIVIMTTISCNDSKTFSLSDITSGKLTDKISEVSLTGMTVSKILDKFHEVASELMFEAENRGNAVSQILGNQIDISIQNANIAFQNQQNTLFENLDGLEQSFFIQLNGVIKESQNSIDKAISILSIQNLNLYQLMNSLPLTKKNYNWINEVKGLVQVHQSANYKIRITGLGFGQDLDYVKYSPSISINGKLLNASFLSRQAPYDLDINVPNNFLEPYFKKDSLQTIPVIITMAAKVKRKCGLVFNCEDNITSTWKLNLVLMPVYAGYIVGTENLENQVLDGKTESTSVTVNTSGGEERWDRTLKVNDNQRIIGVRYTCVSGMCPWSYNLRRGGYDADFEIVKGGTEANVYRLTQGPASIIYYADYQTLMSVPNPKNIDTIKLEFSKPFSLPLSKENTNSRYELKGKLFTGQEVSIYSGMQESPDKLISLINFERATPSLPAKPTYILNIP